MLAFDAYGDGADPRLVLLHGWPLDRSIWSDVAPRLGASGFRVIAPDLPGFGDSPPVEAGHETVEAAADAVANLLARFGTAPLAVAGHSFGGYVALALADRHPGLVSALGLVASRTIADSDAARAGRQTTAEAVRERGTAALLPDLPRKLLAPDAPPVLLERATGLVTRARPDGVTSGLQAMAGRPDRTALLSGFRGPVLVVHGERDQLIPVREAADPRSSAGLVRKILPGAGHMPMWEAPDALVSAVQAWVSPAVPRA